MPIITKIAKCHGDSSPPGRISPEAMKESKQELMERKRKAELHRVLLPDAPPRKRNTRFPSPERHAPVFSTAHMEAGTELNELKPAASAATTISATAPAEETAAINNLPSVEPVGEVIVTIKNEEQEEGVILEFIEESVDGIQYRVNSQKTSVVNIDTADQPCTSTSQILGAPGIAVTENSFESTLDHWMPSLLTIDSDDEDLTSNDIDEGIPLPTTSTHTITPQRTATSELADDTGLTLNEALLVQRDGDDSDRHLRSIVTNKNYFDFTWSQDRQTFTGRRETFTGTPGPTFPVSDSIVDIFYRMIDSDFIDLLITETNRYAEQTLTRIRQDPTKKQSRLLRWTPTDRDEIISFLSVLILQGLYPKIREEAYFSFDGFGTTPYFGSIMSYNRFNLLKNMLHFVNNEINTDVTKLYKIRPIIDYFNKKFSSLYMPGQNICIDESLLKWHGRLSITQKIATKAAQVGIKTYDLCDSSNGYYWRFLVYTGKDGQKRQTDRQTENGNGQDHDTQDSDTRSDDGQDQDAQIENRGNDDGTNVRPTNVTAKVVYELIEPLLHKGHTLIMDNFYNSPLLARCLKRDGQTDVYGTLRLGREFVPDSIKSLTKADMRQGEVVVTYCTDLAVMLWRDANFVSMISTYHPLEIGTKERDDTRTYKPAIVMDYNKSMGGVDRKDQHLASQPFERHRNKIWYKKLFRRLYNAALFNCFVIYTSDGSRKLSHRQFRTRLAEDLLKIHRRIDLTQAPRLLNNRTKSAKAITIANLTATTTTTATTTATTTTTMRVIKPGRPYVVGEHFPAACASRHTRCWMCQKAKKPARTAYKCQACDVPLCVIGCFRNYHKP